MNVTLDAWSEDVEGAAAERALAKYLGPYWSGSVNGLDLPDVGPLGVRHATDSSRCLIVRDRDIEKHGARAIFVSVTGRRGHYEVQGWITAGECRDEWRRDPHGWGAAWFVPARELHPIDGLVNNGAARVAQEESK